MKKIYLLCVALLATSMSYAGFPLKNLFVKQTPSPERLTPSPVFKPLDCRIAVPTMTPAELPDDEDLDRPTDLDEDSGGEGLIVSEDFYAIWDNLQLNPYKISPDSIFQNDNIKICLSNFSYPIEKHINVTSEFGPRRRRFHYGIDLKLFTGDSVLSAMDGMVRIAKRVSNYGNLIVIRHNNGLETFYGHLSKLMVKPGQAVKSGELIGLGGSTGRSTGPHLHFETRYMGLCMNPRDLIDFDKTLQPYSDTVLLTRKNFDYRKRIAVPATRKSTSQFSSSGMWTVRSGDSLGLIAQRTGSSVRRLCSLNGITSKAIIRPGQKLRY